MKNQITAQTLKGKAINELQSHVTTVVAGAAAVNTPIAVAGITKALTTIQSATLFTAGVPTNITSTVSIPSDGNIQSTGATGAANQILLSYYNAPTEFQD